MNYNNISKILDEFDFTDSIIIDIYQEKLMTKFSVLIDYYWDIQESKNETRILDLSFVGCTKIINNIAREVVKAIELGNNVDSYFTIVRIEKKSETSIAIYNGIGKLPIIEIEFENVTLSEKKNHTA